MDTIKMQAKINKTRILFKCVDITLTNLSRYIVNDSNGIYLY